MTESFTSQVLRQTIKQVRAGSRDLTSTRLEPYYRGTRRLSAEEVASRAAASAAFRQEAGFRPLSTAEAAQQIGDSGGRALFLTLMSGLGLEREYDEDVVSQDAVEGVPDLGDRTTFADTKAASGASLTVQEARAGLRAVEGLASRLPTGGQVKHILEPAQPALADDDSVVQERLEKMWDYVRDLLP